MGAYDGAKFPKGSRKRNKKLLAEIAKHPYLICSRSPCDPAHVKSRGAGGDDTEANVIPLCRPHHREQHRIGIKSFAEKYPAIKRWVEGVQK